MIVDDLIPSIQYVVDRHSMPSWHLDGHIGEYDNFMLVISGKVYIAFGPDAAYKTVEGGNLVYCPQGSYRKAYTDVYDPMHCYAVNINYALCSQQIDRWDITNPVAPLPLKPIIPICNIEGLASLFRDLMEEWSGKKPYYTLKCRTLMMEILYRILRENTMSQQNEAKARKVEKAMNYISRNHHLPLTLKTMADSVELSPVYFGSVFKEISGFTPMEYQHYIRINKAKDLLLSGGYTVGEVAELVGFRDIYYFSRVFTRIMGRNPSTYK